LQSALVRVLEMKRKGALLVCHVVTFRPVGEPRNFWAVFAEAAPEETAPQVAPDWSFPHAAVRSGASV
jgi:hypothetical protein